ncbi:asparaginase [Chelativorans sp. AA-79]|uniref:asparaginase n=1 Tax=Chelativorans sp. AA-79 TaxID=3028735 RepID=UPI0023F932AD|nr:asparaginase [Chelativorans sp. AA-79]WEX07204.1 asparaginase [Chelativorans sp. AA-79]
MSRIRLITTGGTIASSRKAGSDRVVANISGAELKARLHDPLDGIEIEIDDFSSVGSFAFDLPLAFSLARHINSVLAKEDCDGVVVTHGTDTMEESCYMADLIVNSDKPVVFTGAQRHAGDADTDGPRNIAEAMRVAAAPQARGIGAVIVFEQDIHAARDVTKAHTSRVDTFRSNSYGKLGEVDGENVFIYRRPTGRFHADVTRIVPEVELMKLAMGSSPAFLDFAVGQGARAIVIEAFGRGNAPNGFAEAIAPIVAKGIPVIVASRCQEGRTRPIYGGGSGGKDLADAGVIFSGDLSGLKARILAAVLLGKNAGMDAFRRDFEKVTCTPTS